MTIHSVVSLQAISRKSKAEPGAPGPKRDAILRAAIDVFADRGYFNAQVADVARAAGAKLRDPRERLRSFARLHLGRLGRDRNLAIVFQVELRQSTKFMERFSSTLLRDYLGLIREAIEDGQRDGVFRSNIKPTVAAKILFGALDEMATNWILSRRRYSLEAEADVVVDLFLNGAKGARGR